MAKAGASEEPFDRPAEPSGASPAALPLRGGPIHDPSAASAAAAGGVLYDVNSGNDLTRAAARAVKDGAATGRAPHRRTAHEEHLALVAEAAAVTAEYEYEYGYEYHVAPPDSPALRRARAASESRLNPDVPDMGMRSSTTPLPLVALKRDGAPPGPRPGSEHEAGRTIGGKCDYGGDYGGDGGGGDFGGDGECDGGDVGDATGGHSAQWRVIGDPPSRATSYCSSANHGAFGSYLPDEDYYTDEELPAAGLPPPVPTQSNAAFATSKVEWRDEQASAAPSPPP